ncbi:glycan metabolism protein RagB [Echinicola pacifica]|uniref:Glycan metabolism protein RagB n=1 Tax=Echinicola pacifica TaxID=346377 RepID=A0A918PWH4_9BACT|nr:RagB/SusD family nutrient uptake outer membrane protein [Echinicola pacifica]GGZ23454.1 glycan metabolism protein RagB [Echinicola pacifica]
MKKLSISYILLALLALGITSSCSEEFLDQPALGALGDDVLANRDGVNNLLIGAYAALDGQGSGGTDALGGGSGWEAAPENWIYGTVAGGEASKGSFAGDQPAIDPIVNFYSSASNGFFNTKWKATYEGIKRTNNVLTILAATEDLTQEERDNISAQARFLRGHFYFELKKMFNMVPWVDENTEDPNQPNNVDIWPNIEADFEYAYDKLPETQDDFGRANKWAAAAYMGKTYLYQKKYQEANTIFKQVIANGVNSAGVKYELLGKFADNFDAAKENNSETIFDIQMVANAGTGTISNSNSGNMLNFPYNSPFRCCGFYQPTQDLVNSFKTDPTTGLPILDNYNQDPVKSDMGLTSTDAFVPYTGSLDPRLDWTVGRRGIPYHDWGHHPGQTWVRDQSYGGPYAPKKTIYWQATQGLYSDQSTWAPGTAINVHVIRYADVLLMTAETEAQLGNLTGAMALVNEIRARAMNVDGYLKQYINVNAPMNGFSTTPAANYNINLYTSAQFGDMDSALKVIYRERKLELAMEGHRFFDLVRWGIAESELNAYFAYQGSITKDVEGGKFTAPKNNYYPIPQRQIDLSVKDGTPMLTQNPSYN